MTDRPARQWNKNRSHLVIAAALTLLIGVAYYLYFRILSVSVIDPSNGSLPSLVHMLVLTWMAFAFTGIKRGLTISAALLLFSVVAEWKIGFADTLDTLMLIAGFCVASITAAMHLRAVPRGQFATNTALASSGLLLCSIGFITGTSCVNGTCESGPTPFRNARPVYMDLTTLRTSILVSEPRVLKDIGRVYVYQDAVFLNSRNQGIHVLDNRDPANPRNVAFIEIPGNTEVSIRSNYMYVDSYIDLVTLNISDPQNISEVDRERDIFPYDAYQNVPDNVYLGPIDESRGVVISYVLEN